MVQHKTLLLCWGGRNSGRIGLHFCGLQQATNKTGRVNATAKSIDLEPILNLSIVNNIKTANKSLC